jgi:diguanylate cyclase (GGDEF)-like protein
MALTDPLTSLPNRRAWDEELNRQLQLCHAQNMPLFVAILDLDEFKLVNDQLGFAAGDAVLVAASQALSGQLRAGDFVARVGGDEFGLLLCGVSAEQAKAVADRVRRGVANHLAGSSSLPVTASVGLSKSGGRNARGENSTPSEIFAQADAALRQAKRTGRNRMVTDFDER